LIVVGFNDLSKWVSALLILTVFFASMSALMMRMRVVGSQHDSGLRFSKILLSIIFPVLFQLVVVVFLFFVVASFSYAASDWVLFVCYFLLCVAIGFIQIFAAKRIAKSFHSKDFLSGLMALIALVVFLLGFYPPSGAFLVERVFRMTSSGARDCVVMSWSKESPEVSQEIRLSNDDGFFERSVPLRILIEADGYFFVRVHDRGKKMSRCISYPAHWFRACRIARLDTSDQAPPLPIDAAINCIVYCGCFYATVTGKPGPLDGLCRYLPVAGDSFHSEYPRCPP